MEQKKDIYILGIESSCDDTSAAVLKNGVLLSNVTASQEVHRAYGGVVPELASRAHQQNVVPVVDQAIARACIQDGKSVYGGRCQAEHLSVPACTPRTFYG